MSVQVRRWVHEKGTYTLDEGLRSVRSQPGFERAGAVGVFIGVVRGIDENEGRVAGLALEAYAEKAEEVLDGIRHDLMTRKGIVDVQLHHLVGEFKPGEDLVYVFVAGSHREEVFQTLRDAVERYKSEAPIFKKETLASGESYWVYERPRRGAKA
ncbi:MAG: molybdenum cofactor biosynthesis protein MoaE [Candidatus Bathyarchaeia archaeon]